MKLLTISICSLFLFSLAFSVNAASLSSPSHRTNATEVSFQIRNIDSLQLKNDKNVEIDIDSSIGWAFGIGRHFTEKWAFNFDIAWSDANYKANFIKEGTPRTYSNRMYSSTTNFGGTYHFLAKRFTPFIGASIGWAFVDSNIRDGGDLIYCSPFFPYYCYPYTPTKSTTEFTYGAQIGLRFDVTNQLFFKASAGEQWVDYSGSTSTPESIIYRFEVGAMF